MGEYNWPSFIRTVAELHRVQRNAKKPRLYPHTPLYFTNVKVMASSISGGLTQIKRGSVRDEFSLALLTMADSAVRFARRELKAS